MDNLTADDNVSAEAARGIEEIENFLATNALVPA